MATRGFVGKRRPPPAGQLPPGQYDVGRDFPVLTAEATPGVDAQRWTLTLDGLVANEHTWTWHDLHQLPAAEYRGDIHCVTTWSKFDTRFGGISFDQLLEVADPLPEATHAFVTSKSGYTTNLPIVELRDGRAWVVWTYEGKPLAVEHGGPVRLLVPRLYFWKSAKWVERITFLDHERQGFWERNGYHDLGDPWLEQRYQGD